MLRLKTVKLDHPRLYDQGVLEVPVFEGTRVLGIEGYELLLAEPEPKLDTPEKVKAEKSSYVQRYIVWRVHEKTLIDKRWKYAGVIRLQGKRCAIFVDTGSK